MLLDFILDPCHNILKHYVSNCGSTPHLITNAPRISRSKGPENQIVNQPGNLTKLKSYHERKTIEQGDDVACPRTRHPLPMRCREGRLHWAVWELIPGNLTDVSQLPRTQFNTQLSNATTSSWSASRSSSQQSWSFHFVALTSIRRSLEQSSNLICSIHSTPVTQVKAKARLDPQSLLNPPRQIHPNDRPCSWDSEFPSFLTFLHQTITLHPTKY